MAAIKFSNSRKPQRSAKSRAKSAAKSASRTPNFPTPEQIEAFRRQIGIESADREQRQAAVDAAIERRKREGVTLKGKRLEQAELTLGKIHLSAIALGKLAFACDDPIETDGAAAFHTAIEDIAQLTRLRCDLIANLLGDTGFGEAEELKALTEEQAERMEREEAGAEHD